MKKLCVTSVMILVIASTSLAQNWGMEMSMNYAYTSPTGSMRNNIQRGNGFTTDFAMVSPSRRLSLGLELNFTQYGHDKTRELYQLDDGTSAKMDVTVNNSFVNTLLSARCYLITKGKFLPYVTAKGGWSAFQTDLNIYDPDDWDHCEPVETEILQRDGTLVGSFGAGFRLDFSTMIKKLNADMLYIDFNANMTQGGSIQYMNTDAPEHHAGNSDDVMAEFINTQTQDVHEHHVGHLYNSPISYVDLRLGIAYRINR